MTLERRLHQLEFNLKMELPVCRPVLLFLQYEGEEALKPTQEQIDQYLKESGRCQRCTKGNVFFTMTVKIFTLRGIRNNEFRQENKVT